MQTDDEVEKSLPLPYSLSYMKWQYLVKILTQQRETTTPITYEKLSELTAIPPTIVSGNMKFLRRIEIITSDSTGSNVILTENGKNYGESLALKDAQKEKEILSSLVKNGLKNLREYCEAQKQSPSGLDFEKLFNKIKFLSKTKDVQGELRETDNNYRRAIETVIEILVHVNILDESFLPSNNKPEITQKAEGVKITRKSFELPTNCQQDWLNKLFSKLRELNPELIDRKFIALNVMGQHHEGSIFRIVRFLAIADDEAKKAENYEKLRTFGSDEFKTSLTEIIKEKYSKIFNVTDVATVDRQKLIDFIIKEYNVGGKEAEKSVNVLVQLCRLSDLQLSESLDIKKQTVIKEKPITTYQISEKPRLEKYGDVRKTILPNLPPNIKGKKMEIRININVDVKDEESYSRVVKLVKDLKNLLDEETKVDISTGTTVN